MMFAEDEDDIVLKEMDVFLTKELSKKLWLFQYPVRPAGHTYEGQSVLDAKLKPNQKKVHIELAVDTESSNYSTGKGEHIALSVDGPHSKGTPSYPSGLLDKQVLVSAQGTPKCDRYAVGVIKNNELHLTPLTTIVQIRPDLGYLDIADTAAKQREKLLELEAAGDSSQDEAEEEVKAVTVKFSRPESVEEKNRRLASFDYLQRIQSEEAWVHCSYQTSKSSVSQLMKPKLMYSGSESSDAYCSRQQYLETLLPQQEVEEQDNPEMPTNVLSLAQLKNMSLGDKVKTIMRNAKVIRMCQIMNLLPSTTDVVSVVRALQQVAVLVQGCWVIKSDVLYPKDSFSAYSSTPAEVICKARDYVLWRFTNSRTLIRRDLSSVVKIPAEEMKEILEQIALPKAKQGWQFQFEYDHEFADKNKEVVLRQDMLWNAKYVQLAKHFNLKESHASFESGDHRRRRHSSRSKSRSDISDGEGDKVSRVDIKKEFTFTFTGNEPLEPFQERLASLIREKLLTSNVLNMTDIRHSHQDLLSEDSVATVEKGSLSDTVLENLAVSAGAVKINPMGPPGSTGPLFVLTRLTDEPDPLRKGLADMYQTCGKVKSSALKKSLEDQGINVPDADVKRVLKDCCTSRGGYWYLKGSTTDSSTLTSA